MNKKYHLLTLLAVSCISINNVLASASHKRPLEEDEGSRKRRAIQSVSSTTSSVTTLSSSSIPAEEDKDYEELKRSLTRILDAVPQWDKEAEYNDVIAAWRQLNLSGDKEVFLNKTNKTLDHLEVIQEALAISQDFKNPPSLLKIIQDSEVYTKNDIDKAYAISQFYAPNELSDKEKNIRSILSPLLTDDMSETTIETITRSSLPLPLAEITLRSKVIKDHANELFINMHGNWRILYIRICMESSSSEFEERLQVFITRAQRARNTFVFKTPSVQLVENVLERFARYQIFKNIMLSPSEEIDNRIKDIVEAARVISSHQSTFFIANQSENEIIDILWELNALPTLAIDRIAKAIADVQNYLYKDFLDSFS
jgi:hypothetical protein